MIFELPDIFFGSHKKRKGITTTAGETVRIYKKGRKSLTTSGFFKKSGDIFFGATSHLGTVFYDSSFLSGYEHYKRCSLGRSGTPLPVAD